jgi:hypothetical protein
MITPAIIATMACSTINSVRRGRWARASSTLQRSRPRCRQR